MTSHRCETCKHIDKTSYRHYYCTYGKEELDGSDLAFITRIGCASHSDFQSEREKVLDEFVLITKHEYRLLEWVYGKLDEGRYSDALEEIITGVVQREELRKGGEREWSERERVLDDVVQYIVKHSWQDSTHLIDVVTRYPLVEFIQELRKGGE